MEQIAAVFTGLVSGNFAATVIRWLRIWTGDSEKLPDLLLCDTAAVFPSLLMFLNEQRDLRIEIRCHLDILGPVLPDAFLDQPFKPFVEQVRVGPFREILFLPLHNGLDLPKGVLVKVICMLAVGKDDISTQ